MEVLRTSPDVDSIEVGDELFLRHSATGDVHRLSPTGAILWPCFDGTATIDELAADVAAAFGLPIEQAATEIEGFAEAMVRQRLLVAAVEEQPLEAPATEAAPRHLAMPPDP